MTIIAYNIENAIEKIDLIQANFPDAIIETRDGFLSDAMVETELVAIDVQNVSHSQLFKIL